MATASLPVDDRGLAYGDGLFETLRVAEDGSVPLWAGHRRRLLAGARALGIPLQADRLERVLGQALARRRPGEGVIKLVLTRGSGGRGYLPPARPAPRLWSQGAPLPVWAPSKRSHGIEIGLCSQSLHPEPLAGLKHLNRLPQVLARQEVARQGWDEGLLLSARRQPLETTSMNLFARFGDQWWTPDLNAAGAGVEGVMRRWLLATLGVQGEKVVTDLRPLSHLRHADAVFLCNSVVGVLPVRKLAQWQWPVTDPVRQLQQAADSLFGADC